MKSTGRKYKSRGNVITTMMRFAKENGKQRRRIFLYNHLTCKNYVEINRILFFTSSYHNLFINIFLYCNLLNSTHRSTCNVDCGLKGNFEGFWQSSKARALLDLISIAKRKLLSKFLNKSIFQVLKSFLCVCLKWAFRTTNGW